MIDLSHLPAKSLALAASKFHKMPASPMCAEEIAERLADSRAADAYLAKPAERAET